MLIIHLQKYYSTMKLKEMAHQPQISAKQLNEFDYDATDNESEETCSNNCQLLDEKQIAEDQTYILHMAGTMDLNFDLAIGTSNNTCAIYHCDGRHLAKIDALDEHASNIVGIQFSCESKHLLYTASVDGKIRLWDLRLSEKLVSQFTDTTVKDSQTAKPFTCFDVSPNNRLLAAGTELHKGEAFILFWDVRNVNLLGGYWESHTDDITQVDFHPNDVNLMTSASTDGLINLYDLKQTSEDDALLDSLNTESSIEQVMWYSQIGKDCISCVTHTADVQLWKTDAVEPYAHFRRSDIAKAIKRQSTAHCYIVSTHKCINDEIFILAGSNWDDGEYLRAVQTDGVNLVPMFTLKENKQRVRSSWYNQYHNILVTGGEKGILNLWNTKT